VINKPNYIFEIETNNRKVQFGCEDLSIMREWIAVVELYASYTRERDLTEADVSVGVFQSNDRYRQKIDPVIF